MFQAWSCRLVVEKARAIDESVSPRCTTYVVPPLGKGSRLGAGVGASLFDGVGVGVNTPPFAEADVPGLALELAPVGAPHAVMSRATATRPGTATRRIELVRVIAEIGRGHGWELAVGQKARLTAKEVELNAESRCRVWKLEKALLTEELDLEDPADRVARSHRILWKMDRLEDLVQRR